MSELRAKTDSMTGVQTSITYPHHEIHGGSSFFVVATDTAMGDTDTLVVAFKTPAGTKRAHILYEFMTLVGCHIELIENATWTQGTGSALAIMNRKRLDTPSSSMLLENRAQETFTASDEMILNPTITGGTAMPAVYAFGVKKYTTGSGGDRHEWILEPDTLYAVRLTADGAANKGQILLDWYEHTDSN